MTHTQMTEFKQELKMENRKRLRRCKNALIVIVSTIGLLIVVLINLI